MIRSPALRALIAGKIQETILTVLIARFGRDAETLQSELNQVGGEKRLQRLAKQAAICPNLETFRRRLATATDKKTDPTFESPLLRELIAKSRQDTILQVLIGRFGREARALRPMLRVIEDHKQLTNLVTQAAKCPDLESFKKLLEP